MNSGRSWNYNAIGSSPKVIPLWILWKYSLCKFDGFEPQESWSHSASVTVLDCPSQRGAEALFSSDSPLCLGSPGWEACRKLDLHLFPEWEWSVSRLGWLHIAYYKALHRFPTPVNSFTKLCLQNIICNDIMPYFHLFLDLLNWFYNQQSFLHISLTFLILAW